MRAAEVRGTEGVSRGFTGMAPAVCRSMLKSVAPWRLLAGFGIVFCGAKFKHVRWSSLSEPALISLAEDISGGFWLPCSLLQKSLSSYNI